MLIVRQAVCVTQLIVDRRYAAGIVIPEHGSRNEGAQSDAHGGA
jgi:hypothetical protein